MITYKTHGLNGVTYKKKTDKVANIDYRSGTVNSKSFVGKVLLQIKWKFELTYAL